VLILLIFLLSGYMLVRKSGQISKKILTDDDEQTLSVALNKSETMHVAIVILCLFFIVKLFPAFTNAIITIISTFIDDFLHFQEILPQQILSIVLYVSIFFILLKSKRFSAWLETKIE